MSTAVVAPAVPSKLTRSGSNTRLFKRTGEEPKKLPRPIGDVFWSLNEKTAYRRNRVVQTHMNVVMDEIVNQRESTRRWIRYEAHKFRQRSGKFFNHPANPSSEPQSANIAPPGWVEKHVNGEKDTKDVNGKQETEGDDTDGESDDDVSKEVKIKPKKAGIITEGRKPVVKFSVSNKVKDLPQTSRTTDDEQIQAREEYIRSFSALDYREIEKQSIQRMKRQKSAIPAFNRNCDNKKRNAEQKESATPLETSVPGNESPRPLHHSDKFFDRSKAAYELRLDLKRKATLRRQGVTPSIFTIRDALKMERETFSKSREKIAGYIERVEAIKRAERTVINKWSRGGFEQHVGF